MPSEKVFRHQKTETNQPRKAFGAVANGQCKHFLGQIIYKSLDCQTTIWNAMGHGKGKEQMYLFKIIKIHGSSEVVICDKSNT